jgi:hypothetical protein
MATNLRVTCLRYGLPLLSLFTLLAIAGCQSDKRLNLSSQSLSGSAMQTVVVVGFRAAITNAEAPELVRNPITGTSFMSWPVPEEVVDWLTGQLFERLIQDKNRHFIPPGQAQGVVESIMESDTKLGIHPMEMIRQVGNTFEADAVLIGHVYRWQERVGTDYGVETPASVAFDISLVRPSDGAILWRGNYGKSQKSLFENLFDLDTYVKSDGRWLTARELSEFGLEHLLGAMPGAPAEAKGKD